MNRNLFEWVAPHVHMEASKSHKSSDFELSLKYFCLLKQKKKDIEKPDYKETARKQVEKKRKIIICRCMVVLSPLVRVCRFRAIFQGTEEEIYLKIQIQFKNKKFPSNRVNYTLILSFSSDSYFSKQIVQNNPHDKVAYLGLPYSGLSQ